MKNQTAKGTYVNLDEMIEFAKDGIVSKTLLKTRDKEVSLFCMAAGQTISTHKSSYPATIHVLQGAGEVTLAETKYEAKTNAWFFMPPNLPHSLEASENLVFLLTLFKTKN